jgi:hypothetical protein
LWDVVVDVIEDFNMPHVGYHETPSKLCLENVDQQRDAYKDKIARISTRDNSSIHEFITIPTKCSRSISNFFSKFKRKEHIIIKRIYQCEVGFCNPNPPLVSHMMEIHNQWRVYLENRDNEEKTKSSSLT